MPLHVVDHPIVAHITTLLRDKTTEPPRFRSLCSQISHFLIMEAMRELGRKAFSGGNAYGGLWRRALG